MNIKYSHSNESVTPVTVGKIWLVIQKSVKGEGRDPGTEILPEESSQGGRRRDKNGRKSFQNLAQV